MMDIMSVPDLSRPSGPTRRVSGAPGGAWLLVVSAAFGLTVGSCGGESARDAAGESTAKALLEVRFRGDTTSLFYISFSHTVMRACPEETGPFRLYMDSGVLRLRTLPSLVRRGSHPSIEGVPGDSRSVWFREEQLHSHFESGDDPVAWSAVIWWSGDMGEAAGGVKKVPCGLMLVYRASQPPSASLHVNSLTGVTVRRLASGEYVLHGAFVTPADGESFPRGDGEVTLRLSDGR